jgi:hypothetical protein
MTVNINLEKITMRTEREIRKYSRIYIFWNLIKIIIFLEQHSITTLLKQFTLVTKDNHYLTHMNNVFAIFTSIDKFYRHFIPLFGCTCLHKSLLLYKLMNEAGYLVQFNLGITKQGETLKGHSWITFAGNPLGENQAFLHRLNVIYQYPALEQP